MFTILALAYGDHPHLIGRCLGSIMARLPHPLVAGVRVGLNAASPATFEAVAMYAGRSPVPFRVHDWPENIKKYPALRSMLREPPIETDHVMWFDDDSCLRPTATGAVFDECARRLDQADMLGRVLYCRLGGGQPEYVRSRAWYGGLPVAKGHPVRFAAGGWWAARTSLLLANDWPPVDLVHRGGDVMLGELVRQRRLVLEDYHAGIAVNADGMLRDDQQPRRGFDQPPLGWSFAAAAV